MFLDPDPLDDARNDDDEDTNPQGPAGEPDEQVGQPFTYGGDDDE